MQFYYRWGASDYKAHGCLGGGGYSAVQTKKYGSLHVHFDVQIPALLDWSCSACRAGVCSHGLDDMEFAVDLVLSDAATTCEP